MPDLFETEHAGLLIDARALLADLTASEGRIVSGEISYEQHRTYMRRAEALASQLSAALALAASNHYSAAFCLLRPALEQLMFDRLLCLGNRYVQKIPDVPQGRFEQWKAERKAGADWAKDVLRMERDAKGSVRIELRGLRPTDSDSPDLTLSIYFFLLLEYQPFVASAKEQKMLLPESNNREQQQKYAKAQHEMYHTSLRWPQLLSNLRLNRLASNSDIVHIGVHYRFLSAFVHPLKDNYRRLYGNTYDLGRPLRYDHYSSELCLLYIVSFAVFELGTLLRACKRVPQFTFADAATLAERVNEAHHHTSYLWFVDDEPHMFDRIQEANKRSWYGQGTEPKGFDDPRTLTAAEIRYYHNPLQRIIAMHNPGREWMGHTFSSPWPRADATLR